MRVSWEKRGNRYFAYARVSRYDKERRKVITQNRYLGGDIQTAITNLQRFGQELGLAQDAVAEAVSQLKRQGQELGVKPDACTYDNKDFMRRFKPRFDQVQQAILDATTAKKRKELQQELIRLHVDIISYINGCRR